MDYRSLPHGNSLINSNVKTRGKCRVMFGAGIVCGKFIVFFIIDDVFKINAEKYA